MSSGSLIKPAIHQRPQALPAIPRAEGRIYAITFDMDIESLKLHYGDPYNNAYGEIRKVLQTQGFAWQQGSVYFGGETINANTTYDAVKSQNAVWGSVGPAGDPLSVGTGWLYSQFARASWTAGLSYDYTNPGRSTGAGSSADLLQLAIWWLEGENSVAYNAGNLYMKGVVDKFGSEALAKANGSWNYGVYAVNLTAVTTGARAQDGLIYVPDGGMTLMLLGVGLGGLALTNRRARR